MAKSPMTPLRRRRIDLGLSLQELADTVGVYPSSVSDWELGTSKPKVVHAKKYAVALQWELSQLNDLLYPDTAPASAA